MSNMEMRTILPGLVVATIVLGNGISSVQGKEFVLVHGAAHGAWCWYKIACLLQTAGFKATTVDMTTAGTRDKISADNVTTVAQNTKPLLDYLANNVSGQVSIPNYLINWLNGTDRSVVLGTYRTNVYVKVVLVGHSIAGVSISYAMEQYPNKISHAIFLSAGMPANNQSLKTSSPPDMLSRLAAAQLYYDNFSNGPNAPPTSITLNLTVVPQFFYNLSPPTDATLALTLLDNEPYCNLAEVLSLTPANYGSVRRFYLETDQDNIWGPGGEQYLINNNPPEMTFFITGSDHSLFFSKPGETVAYLIEIAYL